VLSALEIRPGRRNLLAIATTGPGGGQVDLSASTVPSNPKSCADAGGWQVNVSNRAPDSVFHSLITGLPATTSMKLRPSDTVQAGQRVSTIGYRKPPSVARAVRIGAGGGAGLGSSLNISMHMPVGVSPATQYILSGYVRTNGVGTFIVHTDWRNFNDEPSVDPLARPTQELAASWLGWHNEQPVWEPLLLRLESPGDGSMLRLGLSVAAGATVDLYDLGLF
jgi:hypothetical protein